MTFDGRNTIHNGVYVEDLVIAGNPEGYLWTTAASEMIDAGFYGMTGMLDIVSLLCVDPLVGLFLALYETEEIGLAAKEVWVFEIPEFSLRVALQGSVLEMGNFMEAVHVELANEGRKLLMFEPSSQYIPKAFIVENYSRPENEKGLGDILDCGVVWLRTEERVSAIRPPYKIVVRWIIDYPGPKVHEPIAAKVEECKTDYDRTE